MNSIVVDVQCIVDENCDLIIKEMSTIAIRKNDIASHWIFNRPVNFKMNAKSHKVNTWLHHKFHGFKYNEGTTPYEELYTIFQDLERNYDTFFVKGLQKKKLLSKYVSKNVYDLEDYGCPRCSELLQNCNLPRCSFHHNKSNVCTLSLVTALKKWAEDKYL